MNWLIIPLGIAIVIIVILLLRKPKVKVETRLITKDPTAEERHQLEMEIANRRTEAEKELAEEYKSSLDKVLETIAEKEKEFNTQFENKKQQILLNWEEELGIREQQHLQQIEEIEAGFQADRIQFLKEWKLIADKLLAIQDKEHAAVENNKRKEMLKEKDNFYKIILTTVEVIELEELEIAINKLTNPLPFRKAVYDVYYKLKVNDLVKRVGAAGKSGIYKITNSLNGKVYVGQSTDIGNRWKQHAKRGCGAEGATNNKLYPALLEYGLSSFTFEIIQITKNKAELNELEQYWQKFYGAKSFGYSMK